MVITTNAENKTDGVNLIECKNWPFSDHSKTKINSKLIEYDGYINTKPPHKNGKPIKVFLDLTIEDVDTFDDIHQQLDISVVMTVEWKDPAIALNENIPKFDFKNKCIEALQLTENCNVSSYYTIPLDQAANLIWLPKLRIPKLVRSQNIGFYADAVPTKLAFRPCDGSMTFERALTLTISGNCFISCIKNVQ